MQGAPLCKVRALEHAQAAAKAVTGTERLDCIHVMHTQWAVWPEPLQQSAC